MLGGVGFSGLPTFREQPIGPTFLKVGPRSCPEKPVTNHRPTPETREAFQLNRSENPGISQTFSDIKCSATTMGITTNNIIITFNLLAPELFLF